MKKTHCTTLLCGKPAAWQHKTRDERKCVTCFRRNVAQFSGFATNKHDWKRIEKEKE